MSITSVIRYAQALDSAATDGSGKTALAFGDITAKYLIQGGTLTSLTTETITTLGTYQAPSDAAHIRIKELAASDPTKGIYEVHFHNTQVAGSGNKLWLFLSATGARFQPLELDLIPYLDRDATSASDFKDLVDTGYDPSGHNINSDAKKINNVSTGSVTAVNANIGTTQPTNYTGTGASALVKSDVQDYLGSAAPALQGGRFDASVGAYQTGMTPLQPTVAGRTFDVTATGAGGIDWGNMENPTTANNLSATTVNLVNTLTTYTGNTPQTGDAFARLGAPAGASVSADIAAVKTDTGNLVSRITATLFSGITSLAQWLGLIAGKQVGDTTARTELRATGAGSGTYDETTDSQQAIRDENVTLLAALQADTDDIQTRIPVALSAGGMMMSDVEEVLGTVAQPTGITIRKNVALDNFEFPMFDATDGTTLKSGLTITATMSLDGAVFAPMTNTASEVGTSGVYKINLAQADNNADTVTYKFDGGPTANVTIITFTTQP